MGMLDKLAYDDTEQAFPNFDYGRGTAEDSLQLNQVSTNTSTSSASSTSSHEYSPTTDYFSSQSRRVTFKTPKHEPSAQSSSRRHNQPRRSHTTDQRKPARIPHIRRKSADFDLHHDDDELQQAESYLFWCETCLKHCDVPHHRRS